jgi:hypothetical protein
MEYEELRCPIWYTVSIYILSWLSCIHSSHVLCMVLVWQNLEIKLGISCISPFRTDLNFFPPEHKLTAWQVLQLIRIYPPRQSENTKTKLLHGFYLNSDFPGRVQLGIIHKLTLIISRDLFCLIKWSIYSISLYANEKGI